MLRHAARRARSRRRRRSSARSRRSPGAVRAGAAWPRSRRAGACEGPSARRRAGARRRARAPRRRPRRCHELDAGEQPQQGAEALADEALIVGQQDRGPGGRAPPRRSCRQAQLDAEAVVGRSPRPARRRAARPVRAFRSGRSRCRRRPAPAARGVAGAPIVLDDEHGRSPEGRTSRSRRARRPRGGGRSSAPPGRSGRRPAARRARARAARLAPRRRPAGRSAAPNRSARRRTVGTGQLVAAGGRDRPASVLEAARRQLVGLVDRARDLGRDSGRDGEQRACSPAAARALRVSAPGRRAARVRAGRAPPPPRPRPGPLQAARRARRAGPHQPHRPEATDRCHAHRCPARVPMPAETITITSSAAAR